MIDRDSLGVQPLVLALLVLTPSTCAPFAPVARDPWVEDRTLELTAERLELVVHRATVDVDARFVFTPRTAPQAHAMTFAIAEPGGARDFLVELVGANGTATGLRSRVGAPALLPIRGVGETRDFRTPPNAFVPPGSWLRVRYSQPATRHFAYVLRTGAYWSGPIRKLDVVLRDANRRVVSATVERREADRRDKEQLSWRFNDLEPTEAIQVTLR